MIQPNFHAAMIHFPIGLLVAGLILELTGVCFRGVATRAAARWMIAVGALAMIPAALSGVYAISDVARRSMPVGQKVDVAWADVLKSTDLYGGKTSASDNEGDQWRMISGHVWRTAPATGGALLAVLLWMGASDRWRKRLYLPCGLLLIGSAGVMMWGAWMGGEAVYRHGTAVRLNDRRTAPAVMHPATQPGAAREMTEARSPGTLAHVAPPLQSHVVFAGFAISFALAAMALAFRNASAGEIVLSAEDEEKLLTGVAEPGVRPAVPQDLAMLRMFKPAAAMAVAKADAPAARLWLTAALFGVITSSLGLWFLSQQTDAASRASQDKRSIAVVLWETVKTPAPPPGPTTQPPENPLNLNRRFAHVIAGGVLIVLPLLMSALAKWAPRHRALLASLSLLLIVVIGVQVWIGVLMTLDTPGGSVTKFNPPAVDVAK